jgi:hypothetical protein
MTKYYVETGDIREVVVADQPTHAAQKAIRKAIRKNKNANVGMIIMMSDKSFDSFLNKEEKDQQRLILTTKVLRDMPEFKEAYQVMKEDEDDMMEGLN